MFGLLKRIVMGRPVVQSEPAMNNRMAEAILRGLLLDPRYKFRSLGRLGSAIGQTAGTTRALLYGIGARPSRRQRADGKEMWCLDRQTMYASIDSDSDSDAN
jgi:hypothetical protein